MDIKTGLSIYNQPWLIEPNAAIRMLDYWEKVIAKSEVWDYKRIRSEAYEDESPAMSSFEFRQSALRNEVVISPTSRYDMKNFKGFEGARIAMIPVTGPLMKNDFCGDFGTASLKAMTQMAGKTKSVETIVFLLDTPGGTVDGTEAFAQVISQSSKHTVGLITGMTCSAGYWIGSSCKELIATGQTDIIGSIGTMMSWTNYDKYMEERGISKIEVYATRSTDKSKTFSDANKGDTRALIKEVLDPVNDVFLNAVQNNRKGKIDTKKEDVLTGKIYYADAAVKNGLIDKVMPFDTAIETYLTKSNSKNPIKMSNTALAFALVLTAAKAQQFEVVDGGFLLTEEQLNNIEAKLDQDQVTAGTTASALKLLQKQEDAFKANAAVAADLATANAKILALQADLDAANTKITAMGKLPGSTFIATTADGDTPPDEGKKVKTYSFDRNRDEVLG